MSINLSNRDSQSAVIEIGLLSRGAEGLGIAFEGDALARTVFTGVGGRVSQELKVITGSNLLTGAETVDVLEALITSEGQRGRPEGIDNVEVVSVGLDTATLSFTASSGAVDTITFNFADGLLDARLGGGQNAGDAKSTYAVIEDGETIIGTAFIGKQDSDYNVGGFIRGAADTETVLKAAIDGDFDTISLVSVESDAFTVTIDNGNAIDTFTFTGDNAAGALEAISGPIINPGNVADQFVFVGVGDDGLIGIGTANRYDGKFGGQLKVDELVAFVERGDTASGVSVVRSGDDFIVEFDGNSGTTDTVVLDGGLFS